MADNTSKQDKDKYQISGFADILSDIRAILSDFRKEIPEVVEKIVRDRLDNDQDKLSITAPPSEGNIGSRGKHQRDTDPPNQTREKGALISDSPDCVRTKWMAPNSFPASESGRFHYRNLKYCKAKALKQNRNNFNSKICLVGRETDLIEAIKTLLFPTLR